VCTLHIFRDVANNCWKSANVLSQTPGERDPIRISSSSPSYLFKGYQKGYKPTEIATSKTANRKTVKTKRKLRLVSIKKHNDRTTVENCSLTYEAALTNLNTRVQQTAEGRIDKRTEMTHGTYCAKYSDAQ